MKEPVGPEKRLTRKQRKEVLSAKRTFGPGDLFVLSDNTIKKAPVEPGEEMKTNQEEKTESTTEKILKVWESLEEAKKEILKEMEADFKAGSLDEKVEKYFIEIENDENESEKYKNEVNAILSTINKEIEDNFNILKNMGKKETAINSLGDLEKIKDEFPSDVSILKKSGEPVLETFDLGAGVRRNIDEQDKEIKPTQKDVDELLQARMGRLSDDGKGATQEDSKSKVKDSPEKAGKTKIEDKKKYLLENIEKISGGKARKLFVEIYSNLIRKKLYTKNIAEGYMIIKGFGVKEKRPFIDFGDDREDEKPFKKRKKRKRKNEDMPKLSDVEKLLEKYKYQFAKKEIKEKLEKIEKNGTEKKEIQEQEPSEDLLKSKAEFIFGKRMENDPKKDPDNPYNGRRIDAILKRNNITPGTTEAGEFMKNWDWKEAERLAKEEVKLKEEIKKVQTFDELLATIEKYEGIHGSREFFPKHVLKRYIAGIRKGDKKYSIDNITRSLGLRGKVEDLLKKEEKELSNEQLKTLEKLAREYYKDLKEEANWEGYSEEDVENTLKIQTRVTLIRELKKRISDENKIEEIAGGLLEKVEKQK